MQHWPTSIAFLLRFPLLLCFRPFALQVNSKLLLLEQRHCQTLADQLVQHASLMAPGTEDQFKAAFDYTCSKQDSKVSKALICGPNSHNNVIINSISKVRDYQSSYKGIHVKVVGVET